MSSDPFQETTCYWLNGNRLKMRLEWEHEVGSVDCSIIAWNCSKYAKVLIVFCCVEMLSKGKITLRDSFTDLDDYKLLHLSWL